MIKKTLIKNCDVLQFVGEQPQVLLKQDILISDKVIQAIYPTRPEFPDDGMMIDGQGMLAIPGLINTHAHVPMVLFRNAGPDLNADDWFNKIIFPLEANLTVEDVYWGAQLGIMEMIESGVTTFADHYFFMDAVAQAVEKAGVRANLGWAVFEHEGLAKLEETAAFVSRWQGRADGRIITWMAPHSPYLCGPEFLRRSASFAQELKVGIHIHVAETREQVVLSFDRYGKSPVRVLADSGILDQPSILAHCLYASDEDLDIIAGHQAGIAQATKTYLAMAMGLADLPRYLSRGIPVGLATDGAVSSANLDILEQMRLLALTQKHIHQDATIMDVDQILNLAFQGSAKVIRKPDLGSLSVGSPADIVLLDRSRAANFPQLNYQAGLVYNLSSGDVDSVFCDGKPLYLHRQHQTLNKQEILKEITARLPRLWHNDPSHKIANYPS